MVGTAHCISVRPTIGRVAVVAGEVATAVAHSASSAEHDTEGRLATRMSAVSTMSWLVAPRCTARAASAPARTSTRARISATSGITGLPPRTERLREFGGVEPPHRIAHRADLERDRQVDQPGTRTGTRQRGLGVHRASTIAASSVAATTAVAPNMPSNNSDAIRAGSQTAKNGVSPSPWSRMSNRRPAVSAMATSCSRSASGSARSTGSVEFALASSGK